MPESIQEFVDSRSCDLRLDQQASVLKGVKLLGLESRNGRVYREAALRNAIGLYEGARVNVNHPKGDPLGPRDYQDRLGVIRNVELRAGDGLFGALHFNPKHPLAEQLVWDAEHSPENVGLSHNVLANTEQSGKRIVVESIVHVQSVDLVADPATTSGLFEHKGQEPTVPDAVEWDSLSVEDIELHRPDLLLHVAESKQRRIAELATEAEALRNQHEHALRERRAFELLAEQGVRIVHEDDAHKGVSRAFVQVLIESGDDALMQQLVFEQAELLEQSHTPSDGTRAKEQVLVGGTRPEATKDVNEFVSAIAANGCS